MPRMDIIAGARFWDEVWFRVKKPDLISLIHFLYTTYLSKTQNWTQLESPMFGVPVYHSTLFLVAVPAGGHASVSFVSRKDIMCRCFCFQVSRIT